MDITEIVQFDETLYNLNNYILETYNIAADSGFKKPGKFVPLQWYQCPHL